MLAILGQFFEPFMHHLTNYKIIPTSANSGVIELLSGAASLDEIGNRSEEFLYEYFNKHLTDKHRWNYL